MMRESGRLKTRSVPKLLDVVELVAARPETGLKKGSLGTVVENLTGGFFLVEFCDDDGRTLSVETLSIGDFVVR
jgi:hypothetical protein